MWVRVMPRNRGMPRGGGRRRTDVATCFPCPRGVLGVRRICLKK